MSITSRVLAPSRFKNPQIWIGFALNSEIGGSVDQDHLIHDLHLLVIVQIQENKFRKNFVELPKANLVFQSCDEFDFLGKVQLI